MVDQIEDLNSLQQIFEQQVEKINILFLDEVFSSIDIEGIDSILVLLKSFANEYNINIFVVHHAILNQEMFDRILKIKKNGIPNVLEFGSGGSTIWFYKLGCNIVSIENDHDWHLKIKNRIIILFLLIRLLE